MRQEEQTRIHQATATLSASRFDINRKGPPLSQTLGQPKNVDDESVSESGEPQNVLRYISWIPALTTSVRDECRCY